jgi:16S rRNA processing protein RimM
MPNAMDSSAAPTSPEWAWLARIRKPQGRKGEVFADILTDFPNLFAERRQLTLLNASGEKLRTVELINNWPHKGAIVLHFAGVNSITEAEALTGLIVAIPREARAPLAEDEVFIGDLIGCQLIDTATTPPRTLGLIEDVDRTAGPVALLVVRPSDPGKEELLIPFAKAYLKKIDLAAKTLEMILPEGLTDLN